MKRSFASDNYAGIHPEILKAIAAANVEHAAAYGADDLTSAALASFRRHFGSQVEVGFVFNGTAANVLSLRAVTESYNAVVCAETAHINVDECGAPEKFLGCKLLAVPTPDGKLVPGLIERVARANGDQHHVQPRVLSITQSTELGTVYTVAEIRALAEFARSRGMFLHVDGARISNAAAALGVSLKAMTADAGVDVLSFGGTKNGMMLGEAVVFFRPELAENFRFHRKQAMQLASKMRFISAQFEAMLSNDLWLKNARHANDMARLLASEVKGAEGIEITQPVDANAVFARLPREQIARLQEKFHFYVWNETTSEVRWMCSWDTTEDDVRAFAKAIRG